MQTVPVKTILSAYREPGWFASNYTMNLYRGCCHGCVYCDSRSECYHVENFDTVRAKDHALDILERELASRRRRGVVITGSMSDSYNPFEREQLLTRRALELFARYGFGAVVDTKSELVTRDTDMLLRVAEKAPAVVNFTITCADDALSRRIERHVCPSSRRFAALKQLSAAGVSCGLLLMPILPFINDTPENILSLVDAARESGAKWIYPGENFGVTLRQNQRAYYLNHLERQFPDAARRTLETYGERYDCTVPDNDTLFSRFVRACQSAGLLWRMEDISAAIRAPYETRQMSLLGE
ncbi:MAG: radical SAM protein [Eubacteriales bacterium]|nr:radical SAM protein [Eubacteriales bacterium]